METRLLTAERMERMIDAKDAAEAAKVLGECGYPELNEVTPATVEDMLADAQGALFEDLGKAVDDPPLLDVFRCRYDYHNAKTLVKAAALGLDQNRLLLRGGRYDPEKLAEDFRREELRSYAPVFQEAVAHARELLGSSGDPQQADFVLDRAYYAEMLSAARATGSGFLVEYVQGTIDAANLRGAVRTLRMKKGADLLKKVLVEGGAIRPESVQAAALAGNLEELYRPTPLRTAAELGAAAAQGGSLTAFEKACDDAVTAVAARAKSVPFGVEAVISYVAAKEIEFTAVRVIMSSRLAGIEGDTIRERLREAYV